MSVLLYNRSCYSLLESTIRVEQLIQFAKDNNYKAIGICDTNNLFAALTFYKQAITNDIIPIIGMEVKVEIDQVNYPFLIYPINNEGYLSLCQLTQELKDENTAINSSRLNELSNNCKIVIPQQSIIEHYYNQNEIDTIENIISKLNHNYYIGLGSNDIAYNLDYNLKLKSIADKYNIRCLPLKLALYANTQHFQGYQVLKAIKSNTTISDNRLQYQHNAYLLDNYQFVELFGEELAKMSDEFISDIKLDLLSLNTSLPQFITPNNMPTKDYLKNLCMAGLAKRFNNKVNNVYIDRLNYELSIIFKMNFEEYFLIIYDIILYGRKNNIYIGPGRGSAVGSLVAYCLGITHFDPIKYDLYFERFLNPERISMPDIDIDIPDERREELISYLTDKYGYNHVAHIITFGTLAARAVIRDAGKALGINSNIIEIVSSNIDKKPKITLRECYESSIELQKSINAYDENKLLFKIALLLEGLPRNMSTHASGIVVSSKQLTDVIPVIQLGNNLSTQYTAEHLEKIGLIKLDFLGLRNLSTITDIFNLISPNRPIIDILKMPLNDSKTYDLISSGDTSGIFQLETSTGRSVTLKIKPKNFMDIATILAIGRPGPIGYLGNYLENRANPSNIKYLHPDFKEILSSTYGIILFQEQIMQIAVRIAGFSLGKADNLRKAISKKDTNLMDSLRNEFVNGAASKGYSQEVASNTFNMIEKFADYGFNKSHAIAYSLIAYQLAYFKANFPLQFYVSVLNGNIGSQEKINQYILECKKRGIKILPPDINKSIDKFTIEEKALRFPLTGIKGISSIICNSIIKERNKNGTFNDYFSFYARTSEFINKKVLEMLIFSNALDDFKLSHGTMINGIEACKMYSQLTTFKDGDQIYFDFKLVDKPILTHYHDNSFDLLQQQYEALGFYLTRMPVELYRQQYKNALYSFDIEKTRGNVNLLAMVLSIKQHRTKKGDLMAFVNVCDEYGSFDITIMPDNYSKYAEILKKGIIVYIEGNKDSYSSVKVNRLTVMKGK